MHDVLAATISLAGGGFALAYVTKLVADIMQPESARNTWKNASLTAVVMAVAAAALLASQRLAWVGELPFAVRAVAAAVVVFVVLTALVTRLFDMPFEEVVAAAPVIGTTTAAIGGVLFIAIGA